MNLKPRGKYLMAYTPFSFREKTDTEKRLDALEEGQEVQDEAINDLGTATSELAEKEGVE